MSKPVSNPQLSKNSGTTSIPIQPWSVENNADQLMDDLFLDLEKLLDPEQHSSPSPTPPTPQPTHTTVKRTPRAKPNQEEEAEVSSLQKVSLTEATSMAKLELDSWEALTVYRREENKPQHYFDKVLFLLALCSLAAVLFWLAKQGKLQLPQGKSLGSQPVVTAESSAADAQFIEYMQRSLEIIDRQTQEKQKQAQEPEKIASAELEINPPNPAPKLKVVPQPAPTKVFQPPTYLPFSPPHQLTESVLPPLPPPPPQAVALAPTLPPPPQSVAPTLPPPPVPTAQVPPPPTPPTVEQTTPIKPSKTIVVPSAPPIPTVAHTLSGLLENGDNSLALFDINGVTHRIKIGEPIGISGWILVGVEGQKAIIRRNGEVHSIYAGQQFDAPISNEQSTITGE